MLNKMEPYIEFLNDFFYKMLKWMLVDTCIYASQMEP